MKRAVLIVASRVSVSAAGSPAGAARGLRCPVARVRAPFPWSRRSRSRPAVRGSRVAAGDRWPVGGGRLLGAVGRDRWFSGSVFRIMLVTSDGT
ncbi:hypothetical protein GCM10010269_30880 [Streptomyces humidus]|uniref:Uncharacterized protein n=1 Tax=Streptomyces humidus TaxID=52259 RepID=A0A918L350_9ACTN|nr:hypothetical protein GCM10010269_30880 [Streptomyces humidus]